MKFATIALALATAASAVSGYKVRQIGAYNTKDYIAYLENDDGTPISPFHDVPLYPNANDDSVFNMIVEIPRGQNAKVEIQKDQEFNPFAQKVSKHDKLKFIANIYPWHGYPWSYGSIPQTWENPHVPNKEAGTKGGDNDPLDIIDISAESGFPGQVRQVKLLGGLLMVDDDTTDWKIVAIDVNDERASRYNDITDVEQKIRDDIQHWFKVYKVPQGDGENEFGYDGDFQNRQTVDHLLKESHGYWNLLINGTIKADDIETINVSVQGSKNQVKANSEECKDVPKADAEPDAKIDSDAIPTKKAWAIL
ncbi:hypothetical protein BDA99DRAFT_474783 [Phascolomyces articulosus]|uniref:inorganic diphosphatase n=1 Tax=Phascolomyces articulosus TaxID=60185 RepID=A0AAD5KND8_9FUNG|nr:hypothetical protein BDA99DRAFT_474783 [Phascolomyces articulosus]